MLTDAFLRDLPGLFDDYPRSAEPLDRRYRPVLDEVDGLSEENNVALLGLAAVRLDAGEVYLEAGSHKGRSLIAATLGNAAGRTDRRLQVGGLEPRPTSRPTWRASVSPSASPSMRATPRTCSTAASSTASSVGVFFYDAGHSTDETLGSMRVRPPLPGAEALIVIDDADWERVRLAIDRFLAEEPRARLAERIGGRDEGQPQWWAGMDLLAWTA